uniref:Sigma-70 family RNA polymerase sigma factor n=1 Tax=Roseihalotalea indica TaxID=2867963 RepID=A0AA49GU76_9BACT|nr:hypothetical protein K4G66_05370 [Tunicatimonas sp. TK19036]
MKHTTLFTSAGQQRETLFIRLYQQAFPLVAKYISQRGGTLDEAKDVFHDALIIYYERVVVGGFVPDRGDQAYLLGIAKYRWIRQYQQQAHQQELKPDDEGWDLLDETSSVPSSEKVLRFLAVAGRKCMDLLRAFYYDQQGLPEIAKVFGFSGVRSATVQKYKCLEKVRDTVKEKSLTYEDFVA